MKFGTIKNGKFQEIKVAEIKEPFWDSEAERESEWKLDFNNPAAFEIKVPTPENLFEAIGADFDAFQKEIREQIKKQIALVFLKTDTRPQQKEGKMIATLLKITIVVLVITTCVLIDRWWLR